MKRIVVFLLAATLLSACSSESSFSWTKTVESNATSTVVDNPTSSYTQSMKLSICITSQWENIMDITLSGYRLTAESTPMYLYLHNVEYNLYGSEDPTDPLYGAWVFNESEIIPYVNGVQDTKYTIRNFKGTYTDTEIKLEWDIEPDGVKYHTVFQHPDED